MSSPHHTHFTQHQSHRSKYSCYTCDKVPGKKGPAFAHYISKDLVSSHEMTVRGSVIGSNAISTSQTCNPGVFISTLGGGSFCGNGFPLTGGCLRHSL